MANLITKALGIESKLRYAVGSSNVVIECQTDDASLFPSSYPYFLVLGGDNEATAEVVEVTSRTDQAFTVTRASQSTTARAWHKGTKIELYNVVTTNTGSDSGVGSFHSTAAGSGFEIERSTLTAAYRVYADDGGDDLTGAGSVPDLRAGIFRFLITADQSAGNVRLWGLMGQLKFQDVMMDGEEGGGLCGRLELIQSSGTVQYQGYGITSGVHGIVATRGTILVDTNHIVAGVAAISDMQGTLTQTGIVAGVYVGIYNASQWSNGTARTKWKYGVYVDEDSVDFCPIAVGEFVASAATGGGFPVSLTNSAAMRIYAEVTADLTSAAMVRSILGRMLVNGNITSTAEVFGVVGQLVIKQAKMQHDNAGVLGTLEVQGTAATFSGDIGDTCSAAILGRIGVTVTATAVEADGVLAGVAAMSNVTSGYVTVTSGGVFAGVYVGRFASKQVWDAGVYIDPTACTIPIQIGVDGAGAKVVIIAGNFTDGGASGYGKGSVGIDTTDGLLFYSDSSGNWQAIAAAA